MIVYRTVKQRVEILRIWHSSQNRFLKSDDIYEKRIRKSNKKTVIR